MSNKWKNKKIISSLLYNLKSFIYEFRIQVIICAIIIILGIIFGIRAFDIIKDDAKLSKLLDVNLYKFLSNELSFFAFYCLSILNFILCCIMCILSLNSVYFNIISLFILVYKSYFYCFNFLLLITLLNEFAIITSLIIIFPYYLITLLLFTFVVCYTMKFSIVKNRYGKCSNLSKFKSYDYIYNKNILFYIILIEAIVTFVLFILLLLISNKIIIK